MAAVQYNYRHKNVTIILYYRPSNAYNAILYGQIQECFETQSLYNVLVYSHDDSEKLWLKHQLVDKPICC